MKKNLQLLYLLTAIPLTEEKIKKIYEEEKKFFLKTAIKISKPELDAATENPNSKNEKIIIDIIDPTPGLFVYDKLNLNDQFKNNNNIEKTHTLLKQLSKRLDDILIENRPPKIFKPKPIEKIRNNPLNFQEPDDFFINNIYIDDDADISKMIIQDVSMFKPDDDIDFQIFSPPPRDDRDDFKIKADKEDLIIYKLPTLTTVNTISKEQLKNALNNAFDYLETIDYTKHTNIDDLAGDLKLKEKQEKIEEIKQFMKRLDAKTKEIEKNVNENDCLKKLFDDQFIDLKIRERLKRRRTLTRLLSKG